MGFAKNRKMVISVVTVALAAAALAGCAQNAVTEEPARRSGSMARPGPTSLPEKTGSGTSSMATTVPARGARTARLR